MADERKLETIVRAVLENVFGADRIGDVYIVRALGGDDEEILRIYVEFNDAEEQFDAALAGGWCGICGPACWMNSRKTHFRSFPIFPVQT